MRRRARRSFRALAVAGPLLLAACGPEPAPAKPGDTISRYSPPLTGTWPPADYAKVVGHRFQVPGSVDGETIETGFTLLNDGRVNLGVLEAIALVSAELTPEQVTGLLAATFQEERGLPPAACYEPHHVFLFYDAEDRVTNAIEICFHCTAISAAPPLTTDQWWKHDYRALARLCEALGLGLEGGTAEEFSLIWDERERL